MGTQKAGNRFQKWSCRIVLQLFNLKRGHSFKVSVSQLAQWTHLRIIHPELSIIATHPGWRWVINRLEWRLLDLMCDSKQEVKPYSWEIQVRKNFHMNFLVFTRLPEWTDARVVETLSKPHLSYTKFNTSNSILLTVATSTANLSELVCDVLSYTDVFMSIRDLSVQSFLFV